MADLSWRTGSIFSCCKGLWDCRVRKPITTKHQSVFWLISQSRRMSAICVGICRWISLAAATADPVVLPVVFVYIHTARIKRRQWAHVRWHLSPMRRYQSWQRHEYEPTRLTQTASVPQTSVRTAHSSTSTSQWSPVQPSRHDEQPEVTSHVALTAHRHRRLQVSP